MNEPLFQILLSAVDAMFQQIWTVRDYSCLGADFDPP